MRHRLPPPIQGLSRRHLRRFRLAAWRLIAKVTACSRRLHVAAAVATSAIFEWTHCCHLRRRPLDGPARAHSGAMLRSATSGAISAASVARKNAVRLLPDAAHHRQRQHMSCAQGLVVRVVLSVARHDQTARKLQLAHRRRWDTTADARRALGCWQQASCLCRAISLQLPRLQNTGSLSPRLRFSASCGLRRATGHGLTAISCRARPANGGLQPICNACCGEEVLQRQCRKVASAEFHARDLRRGRWGAALRA